jgi:hypothetical protein
LGFPAPESFSSPRDATKGSSPAAGTRLHPCSLAFQNDERNRITPAVRLKGHSARLPGGLLALASVRLDIRNDQPIGHLGLEVSDHCRFGSRY